jgi:hypothetical protein
MRIIYWVVLSQRMLFHLYAGVVITTNGVAVVGGSEPYDFHVVMRIFQGLSILFVVRREILYC